MNESFSMTASLVLIPGLNNTRAVFDQVVSELPPDVLAMALDNPALPSVDEIAQALLPALPERFWLAGFSFGGYVAMALLAAVPERVQGIAMICTSPAGESPAAAAKRQLALEAVAPMSAGATDDDWRAYGEAVADELVEAGYSALDADVLPLYNVAAELIQAGCALLIQAQAKSVFSEAQMATSTPVS